MNGKKTQWNQNRLCWLLEKEFLVRINTWGREDIKRAESALEVYESLEDFLEKSGWGRDNPELMSEKYLTENRICRWINEEFIYFSRLVWDMEGSSRRE